MRVDGWHVDGFGPLVNHEQTDVPGGLVVVLGANEAGKTSLRSFIAWVLFGKGRSDVRDLPGAVYGSTIYGGQLLVSVGDDSYAVRRSGKPTAKETVVDAGHHPVSISTLLGPTDRSVFDAVFSLDLDELAQAKALQGNKLRDQLFGATLVGGGVSPGNAVAALNDARSKLVRNRSGDLISLLQQRDDVAAELSRAQGVARSFSRFDTEITVASAEVARLEGERTAVLRAIELLGAALSCREFTARGFELKLELTRLERPAGLAQFAAHARTLSGQAQEKAQSAADIAGDRAQLAQARDLLARSLRELGPEWSVDHLQRTPVTVAFRQSVVDLAEAVRTTANKAESAEAEAQAAAEQMSSDAQVVSALAADAPPDAGTTVEQHRERGEAIQRLDLLLERQSVLESNALRLAALAGSSTPAPPKLSVLFALAGVLVAAGIGVIATSSGVAGAVLIVAGVVLAVFPLFWMRPTSGPTTLADPADLADVERLIAIDAAALGLPDPPTTVDLLTVKQAHSRASDGLARVQQHAAEVRAASERLVRATSTAGSKRAAAQSAELAARAAQEQWSSFLSANGLHPSTSASSVSGLLDALRAAHEADAAVRRLEAAIGQRDAVLAAYLEQVNGLLALAGRGASADAANAMTALADLLEAADRDSGLLATRGALERAIAGTELQVEGRLAGLTEVDRLRVHEMLSGGDTTVWIDQLAKCETLRDSLREQLGAAHDRVTSLKNDQSQAVSSAAVALIDAQLSQLDAEIDSALGEWCELTIAERMLRSTLKEFERSRQPEVVRRSKEMFAAVTGGRYPELFVRDNEFIAATATGVEITSESLSRGTREQLYLCLRLALADHYRTHVVDLPIMLDDVLVNFDPDRQRHMARLLHQVARGHQMFVFTCHPDTAAMLGSTGDTHVIDLS